MCQTVWILGEPRRPDLAETVYKGYKKTTKVAASRQRVKSDKIQIFFCTAANVDGALGVKKGNRI